MSKSRTIEVIFEAIHKSRCDTNECFMCRKNIPRGDDYITFFPDTFKFHTHCAGLLHRILCKNNNRMSIDMLRRAVLEQLEPRINEANTCR